MGLNIGSFLNVVIDRVPKHESIVRPRSRCPKCGHEIASWDNIPIISWIVLRGRCRSCGLKISAQYPAVEIGTAVLFGTTAAHFGPSWNLAVFLVLFMGIIPLMVIDFEKHLLPIRILYPTLIVDGAILIADALAHQRWRELAIASAAGAIWFATFFVINWIRPDALGFGDVRLVGLIGLCLGWLGVPIVFVGFFAANILGIVIGLALIATKRADRNTHIPLGVFLGIGASFAVFAGPSIAHHFPGLR
jgi:leader peptidase (prepilin peptidase)/N-methyltransferase